MRAKVYCLGFGYNVLIVLQVELAQVEYQLPRLTRMWSHLERQVGGSGSKGAVKGMGEKQIEVDKRILRKRVASIKRELEEVRTSLKLFLYDRFSWSPIF